MNRDSEGLGGSFSVDGENVEVDLAEFGWERGTGGAGGDGGTHDAGAAEGAADPDDGRVRLQKALAHAGIASRRACESLITTGRVRVNGKVERELGSRVNPETDEVRVDGVVVQLDVSKRYFVLNKPQGVVSTMSDEHGRPDLREFTDQINDRLYNVGRLDTDTSGLLILTNDGELAHKLAHPSFGVSKTYVARVRGRMTGAVIQQLKNGIELKDGPIHADRARILSDGGGGKYSLVELTLHSGRNRIVRRMLAEVGFPVIDLVRRQFGPLSLGTLGIGEMRELSAGERGALLSVTSDDGSGTGAGSGGAASGGSAENPSRRGWAKSSRAKNAGAKGGRGAAGAGKRRDEITAGRPGDGKGARGLRGIAARGNPHGRRTAGEAREWTSRGEAEAQERRAEGAGRGGFERNDRERRSFDRNDRNDRNDRGDRSFDRGGRAERPGQGSGRARVWSDRDNRDGRGDRNERYDRNDRDNRYDRGDRNNRSERGDRNNRNSRNDRSDRNDRGYRGGRDQRGGAR